MKPVWWKHEDWLAVWLGSFFLAAILLGMKLVMPSMKWQNADGLSTVFSSTSIGAAAVICILYLITSLPGVLACGGSARRYIAGFPIVFLLAWLAQVAAGNSAVNYWGIEYVIFGLIFGLFVSNVIGVPPWLAEAVRTEYFIKTGLVIMGATILFQEILQAGALGMLQAFLVVTVVWYFAFWVARRMKVDEEFSVILASAVSICGVSAAIATCGAIQGDKRKLSYVASVVLIVAIPMIVLQPWIVKGLNMPDAVGGAWLGGTLDSTASVVAAGALISDTAMKIGTIVKFSQNVLIGFAAFALSIWWTFRQPSEGQERPTAKVIWERFPKFVLGFMAASLLFSFILSPETVRESRSMVSALRTWWFALAFTSVGLETRFTDLLTMEQGRPFFSFVIAQGANLVWTLVLAYLIFGGYVFSAPLI